MKVAISLTPCLLHAEHITRGDTDAREAQARVESHVGHYSSAKAVERALGTVPLRNESVDAVRIHIILAFDCERCQWTYQIAEAADGA